MPCFRRKEGGMRYYTRQRMMMSMVGYDLLNYLSNEGSTGANFPYFNLGFAVTPQTKIVIDMVQVESFSSNEVIFGAYSSLFLRARNSTVRLNRTNSNTFTVNADVRTRAKITIDKNEILVEKNGTQYRTTHNLGNNFVSSGNVSLFFGTGYQTNWNPTKWRVYAFEAWEGDTLIRNLVAARNKITGVIGAMDLANNKFYAPVRGAFRGG